MAFAGHVLRGFSAVNALLILEGNFARQKPRPKWLNDMKSWTELETYRDRNGKSERFIIPPATPPTPTRISSKAEVGLWR